MAISAQDVLDQALDLAEMEHATGTTGFANRNRIQDSFNKAMSRLHYRLAAADNDWWCSEATIPISAGTTRYGLPNGTLYSSAPQFYKLRNLLLVYGNKLYNIPKFQVVEIDGWESTGPQTDATLTMQYIPAYVPITRGDWQAVDISYPYPPGWEDYVACFIARRLTIRDENYERARELKTERDEALADVMQQATPRDVGRPERVVDVTGRWQSDVHGYWGVNYAYRLFGDYLEIGQPSQLP